MYLYIYREMYLQYSSLFSASAWCVNKYEDLFLWATVTSLGDYNPPRWAIMWNANANPWVFVENNEESVLVQGHY